MVKLMSTNFDFANNARRHANYRSFFPAHQPPPAILPAVADVFSNHLLLSLIIDEFLPSDPTSLPKREDILEGRRQLKSLALTCKATKELALDRLWSHLDSLLPLVKVLPGIQLVDSTYYFRSVPLPAESTFRRYARRLRVLGVIGPPSPVGVDPAGLLLEEPSVSPQVYVLLAGEANGTLLFPNLRKIVIGAEMLDPTAGGAVFPILFSPRVETITFSGEGLVSRLFASHSFPLLADQSSRSLKHLTLENQTGEVSPDIYNTIVRLANLESLDLRLPHATGFQPRSILSLVRALNNLRSLTLDVHFAEHQVADRLFTQDAAHLGLNTESLVSVHLFSRSSHRICGCIPAFLLDQMTHLTIVTSQSIFIHEDAGEQGFDWRAIQRRGNLRTLELVVQGHVGCTGNGLLAFAGRARDEFSLDAWTIDFETSIPCVLVGRTTLKSIRVSSRNRTGTYKAMALTCLQCVADEHKGNLQSLATEILPVSMESVISQPPTFIIDQWLKLLHKYNFKSYSNLRTLAIRELPGRRQPPPFSVEDIQRLAQIFDIMFPSLVAIQPFTDVEENDWYWKGRWSEVEKLRKTYQALRFWRTL
ncbi:hypothetical protein D9611_005108 [Ephemerocybe angulata]|uniref:Uncharacterized protein n=1 Tax=Ephemerocybe angulata TaxID=980116 RepID=A0A8H5FD75_9AGAR|nr:hypothetical protein D9611_005108 [Tulosesus angulatus]